MYHLKNTKTIIDIVSKKSLPLHTRAYSVAKKTREVKIVGTKKSLFVILLRCCIGDLTEKREQYNEPTEKKRVTGIIFTPIV